MIDATFLRSAYKCIYGQGCQGVHDDPTPELMQGCCSFGAHFLDDEDFEAVSEHVERLEPRHWKNHAVGARRGWWARERDGSQKTRVVNGACIFHNPPGFEGGTGCAFHIAAVEAGERHMDWKPDVCWQVPVRLQETTDEDGHIVTFVREWKRRDWGDGGHEFHWWCTASPEAFVGREPTYKYLKNELTELVGSKVYALLVKELAKRVPAVAGHPVTLTRKPKPLTTAKKSTR